MSINYDPSWGVPLIALTFGGAAVIWAFLASRAFDRKYGVDKDRPRS